jgi:glycerol-3-phosphate dehydrogenase
MIRDPERLTSRIFDVLVVGGGIHGLTTAYDAAQRGLAVALIERSDFGSGASFNHLRTIHGGLRYLQHLDIRRARESVRERRALAHIAPHGVRPLAFALPLYRSFLRGRLAMRAGFLLDRMVAADRNVGVPAAHRLPAGRVTSRGEAIERFPGLGRRGLTGAAVWHDYTATEADRLTIAWAIAAVENGAVLANHVDADAPLVSDNRVAGVRAIDRLSGRELPVAARVTVNATGGEFDTRLPGTAGLRSPALMKAMNLVTRRDAGDEALGGRSPSGRNVFLVPSRNRAIFGTWESSNVLAAGESARPTEAEVLGFINELNLVFPSLDLVPADVTLVHYGAVPAAVGKGGRVVPAGHERIYDHAVDGLDGLLSIAGTKYTTARAVAERVTNRVIDKLKVGAAPCRTASAFLPGGAMRDVATAVAEARRLRDHGLPSDSIPHLVAAFGSRYEQVLALAGERPEWRSRVADNSPVIGAELVWAVRHEMAVTLADAVVRRTPLGAMGYPGDAVVERAAAIVGTELAWTDERRRREVDQVREFYRGRSLG